MACSPKNQRTSENSARNIAFATKPSQIHRAMVHEIAPQAISRMLPRLWRCKGKLWRCRGKLWRSRGRLWLCRGRLWRCKGKLCRCRGRLWRWRCRGKLCRSRGRLWRRRAKAVIAPSVYPPDGDTLRCSSQATLQFQQLPDGFRIASGKTHFVFMCLLLISAIASFFKQAAALPRDFSWS